MKMNRGTAISFDGHATLRETLPFLSGVSNGFFLLQMVHKGKKLEFLSFPGCWDNDHLH